MNPAAPTLLFRIRLLTVFFIAALVLSGATAIPLAAEVSWLAEATGANSRLEAAGSAAPAWSGWLVRVASALEETGQNHPFLFYGTDWLAFGHFAIAIVFIGALRDPVRNDWLFVFGLIACALIIPYAMVFGAFRGIPFWWRLVDCRFGVFGAVPLWLCLRWTRRLSQINGQAQC